MSQESKTPRTDALVSACANLDTQGAANVMTEGCRQLETELAAMAEERDAFMASSRIAQANEATANSRLAFMVDAQAQVAEYSMGWNCEWHCDYNDKHETGCYPAAIEAIDAAIKARDELRKAREIEPTTEPER